MADNQLHKLKNLEVPPPEGTWNKILERLNTEFDKEDAVLSKRLEYAEATPPAGLFNRISEKISTNKTTETGKVKIINAPYFKVAVAAAFIGIVSAAAFYFLNYNLPTSVQDTASHHLVNTDTTAVTLNNEAQASAEILEKTEAVTKMPYTETTESFIHQATHQPATVQYAELYPNEFTTPGYVTINSDKMMVKPDSEFYIEAPLIRDETGAVIMDMGLVKDETGEFVIVTSPNGKQTRLSGKFADKLRYLNTGLLPVYFDFESFEWSHKFDEWRSLFMSNNNFIPTAGNFLDILELKNIIQKTEL